MTRARFTEADVSRALKAAKKAQPETLFSVEVGADGTLRIIPVDPKDRRGVNAPLPKRPFAL